MKLIAIVNPETSDGVLAALRKLDIEPIPIDATDRVDRPLSGHPDLQVFPLGERLYCHPDISPSFLKKIGRYREIVLCRTRLGLAPRQTVPYCVAHAGVAAFHRAPLTDGTIKTALEREGIPLVDVRQGFAKCCTVIAAPGRVITGDGMIHRKAGGAGLDSLCIAPGHVPLRGYRHGFLGGASGSFGGTVLFTGNLDSHPDRDRILEFIHEGGCAVRYLSNGPACDTGSILILDA